MSLYASDERQPKFSLMQNSTHLELDGARPIPIPRIVGSTLNCLAYGRQPDPLPNDLGGTQMPGSKCTCGITTDSQR